jgi:hypothetical protein
LKRAVLIVTLAFGCSSSSLDGLAAAVDHGGPKVQFDLAASPLPQVPFPNDVLTTDDSTSPTGLRLNGSLAAPSQLASRQRATFNQLDGFGTFAPITVSFDRDIDFNDLFKRQNDGDPANDGVYVINLLTGALVPLDFGAGRYPYTIDDPTRYFPADPDTGAFNLLFPVVGAAANFFDPTGVHATVRQQADDLVTFYELATHTLIIRPVVPLGEDTPYAVVLTNRVQDAQQRPVSSPHSGINHASQTHELQPLLRHLPPGTQLSDIAYTWAFTTQSVSRTLNVLRRGLVQAVGPFAILNPLYAVAAGATATTTASRIAVLQERGTVVSGVPSSNASDYLLPVNDCAAPPAKPACFKALLDDPAVSAVFSGMDLASIPALEASLKYVNYLVSGLYTSPDLLTGLGVAGDHSFEADEASSTVRQVPAPVLFLLAIPKEVPAAGHFQPFPTVISGHDFAGNRTTAVVPFAGSFAKFGLATAAIDAYGYGVNVDPALEVLARGHADDAGLSAFASIFFASRARDLDFDGEPDPGGDFFTADVFHTRDTIRQSVLDWMQLVQVLRSFDGNTKMTVGANGAVLAGDFNLDGVPDLAGERTFAGSITLAGGTKPVFAKNDPNPGADLFTFGVSLGGILSAIVPAVEPEVRATAPVSAGGGLADVALRSSLPQIVGGVYLELLGPFFATCPFSPSSGAVDPQTLLHVGACNPSAPDAVPSLVLVVQDVSHERDLPIQPLTLATGDHLMVQNLSQAGTNAPSCSAGPAAGCGIATADANGAVRVPIPADGPQIVGTETPGNIGAPATVSVTVLSPGDALRVTVLPASGGPPVAITTFGAPFTFQGVPYKAGDPLTAPARGFGLNRNTPELRRMMQLVQTALEPADPVNYAPHYNANNLYLPRLDPTTTNGTVAGPLDALLVATSGDTGVPISTGISLARAAGLVEPTQPDPAYKVTDEQVLIRSGAVEGIAATARFDDPNGGAFAQLPGLIQCDNAGPPACSGAVLIDTTGYACNGSACTDGLGAPRLVPPLRQQLQRVSTPAGACPISERATGPGCWSVGASACATNAPGLSALMIPYMNRTGQTGFTGPQPQKPFDMDQFMANAIGRWFECRAGELHFDACQADSSCPWIPPPPP